MEMGEEEEEEAIHISSSILMEIPTITTTFAATTITAAVASTAATINNMINACTNIPCFCECCNALPNLNIFDNNICEVVSAVFQVVYEVLNFVLTLFRD